MDLEPILTSISLGLLSTTNPCILPLYPGFLAYLSGRQEGIQSKLGRYSLGFFVLAGVLTMMLALGALIALLSVPIGAALSVAIPLADLFIVLLGIALLLNHNPFKALPQIRVPILQNPYINAYLYGLLYGPITLPCSGPLVVGLFTYSLTAVEAFSKLTIFFWFGLGFGIPLLLLSLLSGAAQRWIVRAFARHSRLINIIGGVLLVGVGVYDFIANWGIVQTYFKIWFGG
jgi:cytochrome c-type biogenesis protein